jgi:hypothetical protein
MTKSEWTYLFLHIFFKFAFENIQEWQNIYKDSFYSEGQHNYWEPIPSSSSVISRKSAHAAMHLSCIWDVRGSNLSLAPTLLTEVLLSFPQYSLADSKIIP